MFFYFSFLYKIAIYFSQKCNDYSYSVIIHLAGATWKPVRKLMNPMFNLKTLQSFLPIFNEKTKNFVKDLESEIGNAAFDVMPYANTCTLDAICCKSNNYLFESDS